MRDELTSTCKSGEYFARKSVRMARASFTLGRLKNVRLTQMRYLFWSSASVAHSYLSSACSLAVILNSLLLAKLSSSIQIRCDILLCFVEHLRSVPVTSFRSRDVKLSGNSTYQLLVNVMISEANIGTAICILSFLEYSLHGMLLIQSTQ